MTTALPDKHLVEDSLNHVEQSSFKDTMLLYCAVLRRAAADRHWHLGT